METAFRARIAPAARLVSWLCLIAAATISSWRFGGVFAIDHLWVSGLLATSCLALTVAAALDDNGTWPRLPNTMWPLGLALLLGCVQLIPLPSSLHSAISNQGHTWWTQWAHDVPPPTESKFPISLYPASTRHNLAKLAIGVSAFLIANSFSRQRKYLLWTLWVILVNGTAMALFGIVQLLTFNGKLYWNVPLPQGGTPFAAFVNRNHAAGYLNLCFAAALGLFVYILANRQQQEEAVTKSPDVSWDRPGSRDWVVLLVGACCALIAAAVVCTTSRGGALAGLMAFVLTTAATKRLRRARSFRWLVATVCVAGMALAIWLGGGAKLHSRLHAVWSDDGSPSDGRLEHWADALRASSDFWITGSGLGTYRFAYQPYETAFRGGLFFHAENQYLEALLEGGWLGLSLLCAALYLAFRAIRRRRSSMLTPMCLAMGTAGLFAIVAQGVHAFFDFGLFLPANATLFGLMIGGAGRARESTTVAPPSRPWAWVSLGLACWIAFGWFQLLQVNHFEQTKRRYSAATAALPGNLSALDGLRIESFPVAADFAEWRLLSGNFQLANYQTSAFTELRHASPNRDENWLWAIADSRSLHQQCHKLIRSGDAEVIHQLQRAPAVQDQISAAYRELGAARNGCPLIPRVHLGLAQLGIVMGEGQYELERLEIAERTAPFAPAVSFRIGLLHLQAGRMDAGFAQWNRCLLLSPQYIDEVMQLAASVTSTSELIDRVLPRSAERLVQIADRYFAEEEATASRARLADMAESALADNDQLKPGQRMALQGHVHRLRGENQEAIRELTAAVALAPRDVLSRFELAQLLLASDQLREAQHHATICQRMDPGPTKYGALLRLIKKRLLGDLERR